MSTVPRRDDALTPAVAAVILVAFAVVLGGSMYAWASRGAVDEARPTRGLVLTDVTGTQSVASGQLKSWSLAYVTPGAWYGDFRVAVDGVRVPCSAVLGESDSWRIWADGAVLPCDDAGVAPHRLARAGDQLDLWDAGAGVDGADPLRGKRLFVSDALANSVVLNLPVS